MEVAQFCMDELRKQLDPNHTKDGVEPPEALCCPITTQIMRNPVKTPTGHRYDRSVRRYPLLCLRVTFCDAWTACVLTRTLTCTVLARASFSPSAPRIATADRFCGMQSSLIVRHRETTSRWRTAIGHHH
jgi:hypothetical protein